MRCWLFIGVADRSNGTYTKLRNIMREYIDLFVCLVLYLVVVGMVGTVIGFLIST